MNIVYEWLRGFAGIWMSPFYYVALVFIAIYVRKQITIERRLFSAKLHRGWSEWWRIVVWGGAVGAAVSAVFLLLGATLTIPTLIWLWVLALLLSTVRVRYFCFAYAAGVLGVLQAGLNALALDVSALPSALAVAVDAVVDAHMPSVFALVGVLHIAEAVLVYKMAGRLATPLFFEGKRGKPIGGYLLQAFWPVPMLMLVPFGATGGTLPWPTLFGGAMWENGWSVVAFPVLVGFNSLALAQLPQAKARRSGLQLGVFGLVVLGAGILLFYFPYLWVAVLAAVLCFGLHELITVTDRRAEEIHSPYFVHDERGLKVLAVLPGSPAAALGIEAGNVLRKVNGQFVRDRSTLHAAMRINPAFVKLEVLNHAGESRFLQRAMFANEHHQLGLVLCPDDNVLHVAEMADRGLFGFLRSRRASSEQLALPAPSAGQTTQI